MTFQEYLTQKDPKRNPRVILTMEDLYNVWAVTRSRGKIYYLQLMIQGEVFTYRLDEDDTVLWTMDPYGNRKSRSCFTIEDFKEPTQRFHNESLRS